MFVDFEWHRGMPRQGSEIERTSKTSPRESLVHDLSLGCYGSFIKSWSDTLSVVDISRTICDPLFFNWWLLAWRLFGRAHCRVMQGCDRECHKNLKKLVDLDSHMNSHKSICKRCKHNFISKRHLKKHTKIGCEQMETQIRCTYSIFSSTKTN